jgi:hypothetical protein
MAKATESSASAEFVIECPLLRPPLLLPLLYEVHFLQKFALRSVVIFLHEVH